MKEPASVRIDVDYSYVEGDLDIVLRDVAGWQEEEDDRQDLLVADICLSPFLDEIDAVFMRQWWE